MVAYDVQKTRILEAIVTPNLQPAGYAVVCPLQKTARWGKWGIVQSQQNDDEGYVYVKMRNKDW
jgi:hypothetical protein